MINVTINDIAVTPSHKVNIRISVGNICYAVADGLLALRSPERSFVGHRSNIKYADFSSDGVLFVFIDTTLISCQGESSSELAHLQEIFQILSRVEGIPSYSMTQASAPLKPDIATTTASQPIESPLQDISDNKTRNTKIVPYSTETIQFAQQAHAFQSKIVLQEIVENEKKRIKNEQMVWRMGGAIFGAFLGMGDGFDVGDIFTSLVFSNIGAMGHEVASREQIEFLQKCQAAWLVTQGSPMELASRIGPAKSRIIAFREGWEEPMIFNHHQGHRGDYLVPLGPALSHAKGFLEEGSRQVMINTFDEQNYAILSSQLYPNPDNALKLDSIRKISKDNAMELDPYANSFVSHAEPVLLEIEGDQLVAYRIPIPVHSEY